MLKVTKTWDYNLGEAIMDMQYAYNSNFDTSYIAILGERNFYCLNENGKLQFTKRFEYPTTCFYTYCLGKVKLGWGRGTMKGTNFEWSKLNNIATSVHAVILHKIRNSRPIQNHSVINGPFLITTTAVNITRIC